MNLSIDLFWQSLESIGVAPGVFIGAVDFYLKSLLLVLLAMYLTWNASPYFSSAQRRQLWLCTLLAVAFLPIVELLISLVPLMSSSASPYSLFVFVLPSDAPQDVVRDYSFTDYLLPTMIGIYVLMLTIHLVRLGLSMKHVSRLRKSTNFNTPQRVQELLHELCKLQNINREISLGVNHEASAPLTLGVIRPVILLPDSNYFADENLLRNVILHELSHIKRKDTLIFILSYLLAALNWFNPFAWYALRQLSLEAEFACDDDVLRGRRDRFGFASQLLEVARQGSVRKSLMLANRAMMSRGQLLQRIEHVLHSGIQSDPKSTYSSAKPLSALFLVFIAFSTCKVMAVGDENSLRTEDIRLIRFYSPVYPSAAIEKNMSGFSQYEFDVRADGRVDMDTVKLIRSSNSTVFAEASEQALASFVFSPRTVNGRRVDASRVRYTFNYQMQF